MAFEDIAPTLYSLGITEEQINTYCENIPPPPDPPTPPTITIAKALAIANAIFLDGIESHRGVKGLAKEVNLNTQQVKMLIAEMHAVYAEWLATQEP